MIRLLDTNVKKMHRNHTLTIVFYFCSWRNKRKTNPPEMSDLSSFQQRDVFETKRNLYLKAVEFVVKRMLRGSISSTY